MKLPALAAAVLALAASDALAQGNKLGVKYRVWQSTMEGHISADEAGVPGDEVDFGDHLDLEEEKIFHDFTLWGNLPSIGFVRFNYWQGTYEGEGTAPPGGFTWSGLAFAGGAAINSKFDLTAYSIMWDENISKEKLGSGKIESSIMLGYKNYSVVGEISDGAQSGGGSVRAPMVAVGFRVFTQLASWLYADFEINTQIRPLHSDVDGSYSEVIVDLQLNPFEEFFIGFGYRRVDLDYEDQRRDSNASRKIDADIKGFFVSVTYHF